MGSEAVKADRSGKATQVSGAGRMQLYSAAAAGAEAAGASFFRAGAFFALGLVTVRDDDDFAFSFLRLLRFRRRRRFSVLLYCLPMEW